MKGIFWFAVIMLTTALACIAGDKDKTMDDKAKGEREKNKNTILEWTQDEPNLLRIKAGLAEPLDSVILIAWTDKENPRFAEVIKSMRLDKGTRKSLEFFSAYAKEHSNTTLNGNSDQFSVSGLSVKKDVGIGRAVAIVLDPKTKNSLGVAMYYTTTEMLSGNLDEVLIDMKHLELPNLAQTSWSNAQLVIVASISKNGEIKHSWQIKKGDKPK